MEKNGQLCRDICKPTKNLIQSKDKYKDKDRDKDKDREENGRNVKQMVNYVETPAENQFKAEQPANCVEKDREQNQNLQIQIGLNLDILILRQSRQVKSKKGGEEQNQCKTIVNRSAVLIMALFEFLPAGRKKLSPGQRQNLMKCQNCGELWLSLVNQVKSLQTKKLISKRERKWISSFYHCDKPCHYCRSTLGQRQRQRQRQNLF